ncbi:MAG: PilZ domain-containing protein [Desulfobacterales bacterium]
MAKWFKNNKRKQQQSKSGPDIPFSFSLVLPGQKKLAGVATDASMEGATISFPPEACPDFEPEERVRLSLFIYATEKTVMFEALVMRSDRSEVAVRCQFGFIDTTHLLRDLDPILVSYFNRREAFRVQPDLVEPIEVDLTWGNNSARGVVIDISLTGIALSLKPLIARQLEYADRMTMTFVLPESGGSMRIVGKTAHFEPIAGNIRYSIEFDREKTDNIEQQERIISKYLMQRQMAQLKRRADKYDG